MQRAKRKLEHIQYALELGDGPAATHLADLRFLHNCLPEINPADFVLSVEILGKRLRLPFFIDAITGSTDAVTEINRKLAQVAARTGIGMAVGSQFGAVRDGSGIASYTVVREELAEGLVIGNISALATPAQAQAAIDMLQADALEVHLNVAQELWMAEGDKDTCGLLANLVQIRDAVSVPVIVKETGCGIAAEQYELLLEQGFTAFDCAGAGGTNFPAIEAKRQGVELTEEFAGACLRAGACLTRSRHCRKTHCFWQAAASVLQVTQRVLLLWVRTLWGLPLQFCVWLWSREVTLL